MSNEKDESGTSFKGMRPKLGGNVVLMQKVRDDRERDEQESEARQRKVHLMLLAAVHASGRLRIPRESLEAVERGGKLDVKLQANGDLIVSFLG